jgi:hypothetical protein
MAVKHKSEGKHSQDYLNKNACKEWVLGDFSSCHIIIYNISVYNGYRFWFARMTADGLFNAKEEFLP